MPSPLPRAFQPCNRLRGKVAIVTGAADGLGLAIAQRFAAEGANTIVVDRDPDRLDEASVRLALEGEVMPIEADVTVGDEVERMVASAVSAYGGIDVLINNAGCERRAGGLDLAEEQWDEQLTGGLKSVYMVTRAVWPEMVRGGGGAIVNSASVVATQGFHDVAAYSAAKGGVLMLTKCLAMEGGPVGIRVNCVQAGYARTPSMDRFWAERPAGAEQRHLGMTPLGRAADPGEVAAAYLFLASSESSFVTGAPLLVDGGTSAGYFNREAAGVGMTNGLS